MILSSSRIPYLIPPQKNRVLSSVKEEMWKTEIFAPSQTPPCSPLKPIRIQPSVTKTNLQGAGHKSFKQWRIWETTCIQFVLWSICTCFRSSCTGKILLQWEELTTGKQALKLTQTCIISTDEGSEMYELYSLNFCWANSFLLRVTCRSGTEWLFPEVLLFSLESNIHMTTGCLKNQHDLHQGGTAVCSRRVSCILHL